MPVYSVKGKQLTSVSGPRTQFSVASRVRLAGAGSLGCWGPVSGDKPCQKQGIERAHKIAGELEFEP